MICTVLSYIKQLLILASTVAGCISISPFPSSVVIPAGIASFTVGIKTRATTAIIKKFKSIIKKERNKHEKTLLPAKTKLNSIEILISKSFIDLYISHDEFIYYSWWNSFSKWCVKRIWWYERRKLKTFTVNQRFILFIKQCYHIVWSLEKTDSKNLRVPKSKKGKNGFIRICDSKKSKFIKEQEACGLLRNLGLKTPWSKIPLLDDILF